MKCGEAATVVKPRRFVAVMVTVSSWPRGSVSPVALTMTLVAHAVLTTPLPAPTRAVMLVVPTADASPNAPTE